MIQFNSVYFVEPNITNYEFASEGFTICTRHPCRMCTASRLSDARSGIGALPRVSREKLLTGGVQVTCFRPDVRAHAGIGALRRVRRRAEKC